MRRLIVIIRVEDFFVVIIWSFEPGLILQQEQ
jgi:hypothetical protein